MTLRNAARNMLPQLEKLLESIPCDYAEARLTIGESTAIALSGLEVESISSGESRGGSLRIFDRGAWSFCSFNDFAEIPSRA
ncbi:MAG TPA: DNA gyrase modulator, partial [Smithella sp.]|nr:DNA gyrase modulator [Smithella sp.]